MKIIFFTLLVLFEKRNSHPVKSALKTNSWKRTSKLQYSICDMTSEDRSHKADKMHGAWSAFDQEISNFDEILKKFQNKLSEEPNVSSTDVQVLEHELALCKV